MSFFKQLYRKMLARKSLCRSNQRVCLLLNHIRASSTSQENEVIIEAVDSKRIITLNRPKKLNALSLPQIRTLLPLVKDWQGDPNVTVIIIKGAGGRAFCPGGDVVSITDAARIDDPLCHDYFREEYTLMYTIGNLKKPWIALMDGITMGAGVGLSAHGMFRIATENTLFAMPETALGLFVDIGGGYFMPRLAGQLGVYLGLTGVRLRSRDVQTIGIATHFVDSAKLPALQKDLLSLQNPTSEDVGNLISRYQEQSSIDADKEFVLQPHLNKINQLFSGNTVEEIFSQLERDSSEWATEQLNSLKKMSPTSMKITLHHLRLGLHSTLAECLIREYRLSQHAILDNDFYEGVRAVLQDKDNKPSWKPASLEEVTDEIMEWYFSPLPEKQELKL